MQFFAVVFGLTLVRIGHASDASSAYVARAAWPNGPLSTTGRWIQDASANIVTYAGVNWPGAEKTMLPEGLQYQSIEKIVSKIKSAGMNAIRLTFAIQMIDQIYDNQMNDISIQKAFTDALGQDNGTVIYNKVLANNPSFSSSTTRLQVFDAIAAECAKQNIYVHLDNHVSAAGWCCTPLDGNSWWGDTYFDTANWTRGLSYIADHGKSWSSLVSIALRNELRQPLTNVTLFQSSYNWQTWYANMKQGAAAVNKANPTLLIFLSGLDSDTTLQPIVEGTALTPSSATFDSNDFQGYRNKLVLELHAYNIVTNVTDCTKYQGDLYKNGFESLSSNATNQFPIVLTEFGFPQDATTWKDVYASCLAQYLPAQQAGWTIWVLSGSYYTREGTQDADEPWGLLNHDWSDWRSSDYINGGLLPLVKASQVNGTATSSPASSQTSSPAGSSTGAAPTSSSTGAPSGAHSLQPLGWNLPVIAICSLIGRIYLVP